MNSALEKGNGCIPLGIAVLFIKRKETGGTEAGREDSQAASLKEMPNFTGTMEDFCIWASFFITAKANECDLYHGAVVELEGHGDLEGVEDGKGWGDV